MEEDISFKCTVCKRDERLDQDWLHHVSSISHQRSVARQPGGGHGHWSVADSRKRSLTVSGCQKVNGSPYDIAKYLTKWGRLEEFICPTSLSGTKPEEIFCLYKNEESVTEILAVNLHRIMGNVIKIKLKYSNEDNPETSVDNDGISEENVTNGNGNVIEKNWAKDLKLEDQLPKLFQEISISQKDVLKRSKLFRDIQDILRQTFSSCFVFSYGTDSLAIGMKEDSVRLAVDPYGNLGSKTHGVIEGKSASDLMSTNLIFQILSTYQQDGSSIFKFVSLYSISPLTAFTIPEISFSFRDTICKVQFENFLCVQKSRLIRFLSRHDLRIWPLLMLIRHWSRFHGIFLAHVEGEEFENYTLILLMIFYLTKTKVIPSVAHLQSLSSSPLIANNIDISFCSDSKIVQPTKMTYLEDKSIRTLSTLSILKEFFHFFSQVDFKQNVLCTAIGDFVPRKSFKPQMERELPDSIRDRYRFSTNGDLKVQKLNIFSPMCLQDPLDLTENVSRGVDEADLCEFQMVCAKTAEKLVNLMECSEPNLMDIFKNGNSKTDLKRRNSLTEEDGPQLSKPRIY